MAINSISQNRGGGVAQLVTFKDEKKGTESYAGLEGIHNIVGSIRDDIANLQKQFDNLPPVPEGKRVPTPLA